MISWFIRGTHYFHFHWISLIVFEVSLEWKEWEIFVYESINTEETKVENDIEICFDFSYGEHSQSIFMNFSKCLAIIHMYEWYTVMYMNLKENFYRSFYEVMFPDATFEAKPSARNENPFQKQFAQWICFKVGKFISSKKYLKNKFNKTQANRIIFMEHVIV